jgi:hypothetical protein
MRPCAGLLASRCASPKLSSFIAAKTAPRGVVAEVIAGVLRTQPQSFDPKGTSSLLANVWRDETRVRVEPFDAIELELGLLWNG